ncbi:hypothetical protein CK203_094411 [Vitis vinifera]|uniref:Uncharacterized protein n=1 Tax=Vitis vinifera TaxID=29760 RepID=A0A438CS77_VITVI|nr:hypothetical protein CK203_094411 [Vitis vinifera]
MGTSATTFSAAGSLCRPFSRILFSKQPPTASFLHHHHHHHHHQLHHPFPLKVLLPLCASSLSCSMSLSYYMIRMGGNKVRVQCIWTVLPMNQCFCTVTNDSNRRTAEVSIESERSEADKIVDGMDFGELCNEFECISSPLVESTARQLARDILELREGNRALGTFAVSVKYKFLRRHLFFVGFFVQTRKPCPTLGTLRLDTGSFSSDFVSNGVKSSFLDKSGGLKGHQSKDPVRSFTGREKYKRRLWVTDALDDPSVTVQEMVMLSTSVLSIKWTIKGKPKSLLASIGGDLIIRVNSQFTLNQISGQVIEHEEFWDLSASSAIAQAYFWASRRLFAATEAGKDFADSVKNWGSRLSTEKENWKSILTLLVIQQR